LIETSEKNPYLTSRILAEKFECGEAQVNTILAKQESFREQHESNFSNDGVLLGKRSRLVLVNLVILMNPFIDAIP